MASLAQMQLWYYKIHTTYRFACLKVHHWYLFVLIAFMNVYVCVCLCV